MILEQMNAILKVLNDPQHRLYAGAPQWLKKVASYQLGDSRRDTLFPTKGKKSVFIFALMRLKRNGARLIFATKVLKDYYDQQGDTISRWCDKLKEEGGHETLQRREKARTALEQKASDMMIDLTKHDDNVFKISQRDVVNNALEKLDALGHVHYEINEKKNTNRLAERVVVRVQRRIGYSTQCNLFAATKFFNEIDRNKKSSTLRDVEMAMRRKQRGDLNEGLELVQARRTKQAMEKRMNANALNEDNTKRYWQNATSAIPCAAFREALVQAKEFGEKFGTFA
jgi:hypothetical protein